MLTCLVPSSFGSLVLLPQNYTHLNVNRLLPRPSLVPATLPSAHYVHLHSYCLCVAMSPPPPSFSAMSTMILVRVSFYPFSGALQASSLHSLLQPDLLHTNKIWSKWKTHYLTTSWRLLLAASFHRKTLEYMRSEMELKWADRVRVMSRSYHSNRSVRRAKVMFGQSFIDCND